LLLLSAGRAYRAVSIAAIGCSHAVLGFLAVLTAVVVVEEVLHHIIVGVPLFIQQWLAIWTDSLLLPVSWLAIALLLHLLLWVLLLLLLTHELLLLSMLLLLLLVLELDVDELVYITGGLLLLLLLLLRGLLQLIGVLLHLAC